MHNIGLVFGISPPYFINCLISGSLMVSASIYVGRQENERNYHGHSFE